MRQNSMPVERTGDSSSKEHPSRDAAALLGIALEGLRGEDNIAELCRREGIVQNLYYRWSKDFLDAGKSAWLASPGGDIVRGQAPAPRSRRAERRS
jgi:transposase